MRRLLSILLALVLIFSFGVTAFAEGGDGSGGGTGGGAGGGDDEWDGVPGALSFTVTSGSNVYSIDGVVIPFMMTTTRGGLKHVDYGNMSQTINSSTVTLTCNGSPVSGFSPSMSGIVCYGDKTTAYFNIVINGSLLSVGSTYVLTIKAGATWANKEKNTATLPGDYSYSFSVTEAAAQVETTTASSKQSSPLTTKAAEGSAEDKNADAAEVTTADENTAAEDEITTAAEKTGDKTDSKVETIGALTTPEVVNDDSKTGVIAAVITVCILPMGAYAIWRKKH